VLVLLIRKVSLALGNICREEVQLRGYLVDSGGSLQVGMCMTSKSS
jgi:hypothetical protein